jgi:ribosomal protein S20
MANTGCSSTPSDNVPIVNGKSVNQSVPGSVSNGAKKALTAAHQAYNAVGQELISAANSNILHGDNAAKAKQYYDKAGDALKLADNAEKAADERGMLTAIADANTLIAQATSLVGG